MDALYTVAANVSDVYNAGSLRVLSLSHEIKAKAGYKTFNLLHIRLIYIHHVMPSCFIAHLPFDETETLKFIIIFLVVSCHIAQHFLLWFVIIFAD